MRLHVAAPGKLHHPGAIAWADDLYGRVRRILPVERRPVRQARRGKGGVDPTARDREDVALVGQMPQGSVGVALEPGGQAMNSDRFANWLVGHAEAGTKDLCFFIGGPDGLGPQVRGACRETLALSPMVLPHELAEVVLLEQIYRALTRWKNLPYHR